MTRRAFTLVELLVVITIITIGTILLVPAFGRITASINFTGSVNSVTATLGAARTLAVRENRHTAVAFLWDEETEQISMQILVQSAGIGAALSGNPSGSPADTYAFAYTPAPGQTPVILPKGTLVYGLSFSVEPERERIDPDTSHWYAGHFVINNAGDPEPTWLFPHNDPSWATAQRGSSSVNARLGIDPWEDLINGTGSGGNRQLDDVQFTRAVRGAQTFCVQFAPDGTVTNTPSAGGISTINAYIEFADGPLDLDDRAAGAYDNDLVFDPETALDASDPEPNREVIMRSATQLAIVETSRLRERFGVEKPWHIESPDATTPKPTWPNQAQYFDNDRLLELNQWIDNNAEVFGVNRYSGEALRRVVR